MLKTDPATGEMYDDEDAPTQVAGDVAAQQDLADNAAPLVVPPPPPEVDVQGDQAKVLSAADLAANPLPAGSEAPEVPEGPDLETVEAPVPVMPDVAAEEPPPAEEPAETAAEKVEPDEPEELESHEEAPLADQPVDLNPPSGVEAFRAIADEEAKLRAKEERIREQQGLADAETARIKAEAAKDLAQKHAEAEKRLSDVITRGENEYAAARARREEEYNAARALGEKDVWADGSVASKVLAGIAMILGGRSGAAYIVGAAEAAEAKRKTDIDRHLKLAAEQGKSMDDARQHAAEMRAHAAVVSQAGIDSAIARTDAELAAQGVPAAERAKNKDIIALQQASLNARKRAEIETNKAATEKLKSEVAAEKAKSETELNRAKVEFYRAQAAAKKSKAAGGGAGGGGLSALEKFVAAANALGPTDQITPEVASLGRAAGLKPNQIAAEVDRYRNSDEKASKAAGIPGAGAGGAAGALRRERVAANIHEFEENAKIIKPGVITPEVLAKVQRNEADMQAAEHDKTQGAALWTGLKRGIGVMAKSPYDGLTPEQVRAMRALDATLQHGAEMQPTTGAEVSAKWKATYRPQPGMDQATIDEQIRKIQRMGETFRKIIDPTSIGARADVDEPAAKAPRAPAQQSRPDVLPIKTAQDKALMLKAKRVKPGSPDYADAQEWLRAHGM